MQVDCQIVLCKRINDFNNTIIEPYKLKGRQFAKADHLKYFNCLQSSRETYFASAIRKEKNCSATCCYGLRTL